MQTDLRGETVIVTGSEQNVLKAMRPTSLLKRFTTTDEVADLCSEQASGMPGTIGAALVSTAASSGRSPSPSNSLPPHGDLS